MTIAIVLGVYIAAMLAIGFSCRNARNAKDFLLAGGTLGPVLLSMSFVATYFSTSSLLGGGGSGYLFGFGFSAYLFFFHVLFAVLAWVIVAPRLRRVVQEEGILTVPQFFRHQFNSRVIQVIAALIIVVFFQLYMSSIYKGASNLLEITMGVSYPAGVAIVAIPVVTYTCMGGFRSVVITDLIQGIILLAGGVLLFGTIVVSMGGIGAGLARLASTPIGGGLTGEALMRLGATGPKELVDSGMMTPFLLSLTFAISVAQIASPQLIIRFFAAKDPGTVRKGMLLTPLLIAIFAFCVFSSGPFAHLFVQGIRDPDLVIPSLIRWVSPGCVSTLLLVAAIAAAMSTLSSTLMVAASSLTQDLLGNSSVPLTRLAVLGTGVIAPLIALRPIGIIVTIVGLSFSVISSVYLVPLLAGLYCHRPSRRAAIASMVASATTCVIWQLLVFRRLPVYPVVPGIIVSAFAYLSTDIVERTLAPKGAEEGAE